MAFYNSPYPATYQSPYQTPIPTYMQPQNDTGIIWVQGESGAKAFPVQNGKSVVLFDSESEHFFIKTTDGSGIPQPLRIFSYKEVNETTPKHDIDTSIFITRDEFEKAIESLRNRQQNNHQVKDGNKNNGKQIIQ